MKTKTISEQAVIQEATDLLLQHMEPAKVAKFLAARPITGRDYLKVRERLFAGETVKSLIRKISAFEKGRKDGRPEK